MDEKTKGALQSICLKEVFSGWRETGILKAKYIIRNGQEVGGTGRGNTQEELPMKILTFLSFRPFFLAFQLFPSCVTFPCSFSKVSSTAMTSVSHRD